MSSVPPGYPPGGGQPPYPPYDPKTQWRVYREQQRAAWRAQRDAWKAQRYAAKSSYVGIYGPRVPSVVGPIILIAIGVIALLIYTGRIGASSFVEWYAQWWPLLLIVAGLALLGEWALDLRRKVPVHRGGSFVGILIMLAFVGCAAAAWTHSRPWFHHMGDNNDFGMDDNFFNMFGMPEHDNEYQPLNAQIPANASVEIQNPQGDTTITAGDVSNIEVQAHEVAYADSDSNAKSIFAAEAPHLTVSGTAVLVKPSSDNSKGRVNLTVTIPKSASVTVKVGKGDVTAAGLGAGINVYSPHGDVHLNSITGSVQLHFSNGKHDFSAHQVNGDLTTDGNLNDLTLSDIKGKIEQTGEILGDVHLESVTGPIHLHTSVTDLQLAQLAGDLTLDSDDLRVTETKGNVRVVTHAKDVDLSQVAGDTYVEDRDGRISVEPVGNHNVEAKNDKGDVEVTLQSNSSANVEGRTRNGDIVSDFALTISGDESKSVSGRIGSGGSKISITTDNGDLRIKKGTGFPADEDATAPTEPPSPKTPHLKAPKATPEQPVTQ
ncbi:MAG: DUF4097 family beta strand repeat-containing protein [Terracidiphilus sp.]